MPNAKDLKEGFYGHLLLTGPVGVGKTTQILTFPGKKFVYCFDPNGIGALRGHDVDFELYQNTRLDITVRGLKKHDSTTVLAVAEDEKEYRIESQAFARFEEHLCKAIDTDFFDNYDVICLDSLTTIADIMMDDVLARGGRSDQTPAMADYNIIKTQVRNVLKTLCALAEGKIFIATGHTIYRQDEGTKKMLDELLIPGDLKVRAPILFGSYLRMDYKVEGEKKTFSAQSVKDSKNENLKSNIPGIAAVQDVTITNFYKPQLYGLGKLIADANAAKAKSA